MSNDTIEKSKEQVIRDIKKNYEQLEKSLVNQLCMKHSLHPGTSGSAREDIWKQLFDMIIPKKFVIEQSVFIIDSTFYDENKKGGISREVDLAIIDETYTPYIFCYGKLKFVPIEAVAAVVECKSGFIDTKEWCERIDQLETSRESLVRIATEITAGGSPTQTATRPIKILCSLDNGSNKELFDVVLIANTKSKKIDIKFKFKNLYDAYCQLNHYRRKNKKELEGIKGISELKGLELSEYEVQKSSLLSFNFKLNQLLMLINNPLPFPHRAYVNMFNQISKEER